MKVLFAASPFTGHVNPLLVAARVLQNAGHETALYTGRTSARRLNLPECSSFRYPRTLTTTRKRLTPLFRNASDIHPDRRNCSSTSSASSSMQCHLSSKGSKGRCDSFRQTSWCMRPPSAESSRFCWVLALRGPGARISESVHCSCRAKMACPSVRVCPPPKMRRNENDTARSHKIWRTP